ncbi:MAG TPA: hypothetical protein VGK59_02780 [Ohtaekwangia sp.]
MKHNAYSEFHLLMAKCSTAFFLFIFISTAFSQVTQPARFERQQKNSDDYFNIVSLKEKGIALFRERDKFKNSNRIWELVLLDTALQEKQTAELEIKERYKLLGYEVTPDVLYFLFRTGETTKNDFELIAINLSTGADVRYTIKPELDFKLTHFCKVAENFAFGGYVNNDPAIFLYELSSTHIKAVPGFFQKETELVDMRVNQNQTFNVVMVDRGTKGNRNLIFRTFDPSGNLLLDDIVLIEENKTLQAGITSTLEREDLILLGTWGERNSKQSNGFFSLSIDPFNDQKVNYVPFGQLTHFLDYLKPKRAEKIKEDTRSDMEQGRIPSFINYVMPYKITEHKEGFLLLAEVYQPSSSLNPYYNSPYYNPYYSPYSYNSYWPGYYYPGMSRMYRPTPYGSNVKNSDEIKTSETVLIAYDNKGQVKWDQSITLDELKMASLEQVADFSMHNGKVHFAYRKEMEIRIKTVLLSEDSVSSYTEKIKTKDPVEEIRSEKDGEGSIKHWYNNIFYTYGYQTIRNVTKEDRVRDVFYINKVVIP